MGTCQDKISPHAIIKEVPGTKIEGFTSIYKNSGVTQLDYRPLPNIDNIFDLLMHSIKSFSNRPALGYIVVDKSKDEEGNDIETRTIKNFSYQELYELSMKLGRSIINRKLFYSQSLHNMKMIGIYSRNRYEWLLTDIACLLFGLVSVPLYDTLGIENLSYCLKMTEITTMFVSADTAKTLLKLKDHGNLRNLIVFDPLDPETEKALTDLKFQIIPFANLLNQGEKLAHITNQTVKTKPDDCYTFSFTSGTTGPPKGAMISHKNVLSFIKGIQSHQDLVIKEEDTYLSYLPLPHVMERSVAVCLFGLGAYLVVSSGNVLKLKDDCQITKPTVLLSVPRLYNRIVQSVKQKFSKETGIAGWLITKGVASKLEALHQSNETTSFFYDKVVFSKVKDGFGGRIRVMGSGSAPLRPETQEFMMAIMCCPLIEGYGSTETTAGVMYSNMINSKYGQFAQLIPTVEMKLCDIPEMKYTANDVNEQGLVSPRGQIWVRGPSVFLGYYKQEDMTKEAITPDGWLKTGDVGQMMPITNAIKIIDRRKNIFKLQQGQYIAPDKVENVYSKVGLTTQLFLHGDSSKNHTVLIATPHKQHLLSFAKEKNINGTYEELCKSRQFREIVLKQLNAFAKKEGLNSLEQAKNIYFEQEGFLGKNIMTNTMKLIRYEAKKAFKNEIQEMYAEGDIVSSEKK